MNHLIYGFCLSVMLGLLSLIDFGGEDAIHHDNDCPR